MHINERQNGIRERLTSDYRPAPGMQKLMSTGQGLILRQILPSRQGASDLGHYDFAGPKPLRRQDHLIPRGPLLIFQ
jgi:hypothetical protein